MYCLLQNLWSYEGLSCMMVILISLSSWLQNIFPIKVGYGKFSHKSTILISASLAWFIYESPNLIFTVYFLIFNDFPMKIPNLALLSLFAIHYIHRDLLYPLKLRGLARKYPLDIASTAFMFCFFNGYYQLYSLKNLCIFGDDWIYYWNFWLGVLIFALGMFINIKSDRILLDLKRKKITAALKENKDQELENSKQNYGIPDGFLFKYVTSANYLGEVIEWIGYGIAGWSLNGFIFAFTTFNILLSRALKNHEWYRTNFKEYPKERKAMIPFII